MIENFWQDIQHGVRLLVSKPGFAIAAAVTLALGIGVNTAIFSLTDAVLFRPFPVKEPGRIVAVYTTSTIDSRYASTSYPDYLEYRNLNEVFSGLLAYARIPVALSSGQHTEYIGGEVVSGNYFDVLGLSMTLGRGFIPEEDQTPGSHPVAIVSHGLWQRNFGSDPKVVGKAVVVDGQSFTVVGIAPMGFRGITLDWGTPPEIWIPMAHLETVLPSWPRGRDLRRLRDGRWLLLVGRLREGVTLIQSQAALRVRARQLELAYEKTNRGWTATLLPGSEARFWPAFRKSVVSFLALLMGAAGLVLVMACSNVANLLLARASTREKEIAIRAALGASRGRLVRQLVTESLLLSVSGLALSFLVAVLVFDLFSKFPLPFRIPMNVDLALDRRAIGIAAILASATVIAFGLFPALRASRPDLRTALQETGGSIISSRSGWRMRGALVVAQVALSVTLLAGAGLFGRTVQKARAVDPGFRAENILVLSLDFNLMRHRYDEARGMEFYKRLAERVRELPGVRSVTWAGDVPLALRRLLISFVKGDQTAVGERDWIQVECNVVGPGYLETLGIPLVSGRDFADGDSESAAGAAIINEAMAHRFWPGHDPVGKQIRVSGRSRELYEIVGVAKNVRQRSLWEDPGPYLYLPVYQRYFPEMMLHVKSAADPSGILPVVRREIEAIDGDLPVFDAGLLSRQIDRSLSPQRMASALLNASALLALILAAVGIYGILGYSVSQRTREIGIRMALGAGRGDILKIVIRDGMILAAIGLVLGIALALVLTRTISSFIHGVSPSDGVTFTCATLLLTSVSLAACYLPARKASRIGPLAALRSE